MLSWPSGTSSAEPNAVLGCQPLLHALLPLTGGAGVGVTTQEPSPVTWQAAINLRLPSPAGMEAMDVGVLAGLLADLSTVASALQLPLDVSSTLVLWADPAVPQPVLSRVVQHPLVGVRPFLSDWKCRTDWSLRPAAVMSVICTPLHSCNWRSAVP